MADIKFMKETFRKILGPRTDPAFPYEHISNARTTAYSITTASPNKFRYPVKMSDHLDISMRYLVVQLFHKVSDPINISLNIRNTGNVVFKFSFSTVERKNRPPLSRSATKIQLDRIPDGIWVNLCFDLEYLVSRHRPGSAFESLQSIEIAPTCLIRWIFANSSELKPELEGQDIPNQLKFVGGIKSVTVLFSERCENKAEKKAQTPLGDPGGKSKLPVRRAKTGSGVLGAKGQRIHVPMFEADFESDSNEDDSDETAFLGAPPSDRLADLNVRREIPENEEEELELVFIEALNCYYCPNNQQYYQLDE
jgi:hypothetical protein